MPGMVLVQVLGLLGYPAFLLATFGWRTWQTKRAIGESRWRKPVSRVDVIGETVCLTGCVLSIVAPLALAGAVRPLAIGWPVVRGLTGTVVLGLGISLGIWAQRQLGDEWRAGVEASDSLVTAGPFARVRNPFYLGCFLASASVFADFIRNKQHAGRFLPRLIH